MFCRYDLRTTDPNAAQIFYSEVVGLDFSGAASPEGSSMLGVWLLHEQARARGAPPHWLGHIGVTDVEEAARRMRELGSESLGPAVRANDGAVYATLRDPWGAVVAVRASTGAQRPGHAPVAWHHLHTRDLERAWPMYSDLFGWIHTETLDVAEPAGGYRMFAWEGSDRSVGSMANSARSPGVHPHWLFYFPVADLDAAVAKVQARGGQVSASPVVIPNGDRVAPCEDPQGAAFGLYQSRSAPERLIVS